MNELNSTCLTSLCIEYAVFFLSPYSSWLKYLVYMLWWRYDVVFWFYRSLYLFSGCWMACMRVRLLYLWNLSFHRPHCCWCSRRHRQPYIHTYEKCSTFSNFCTFFSSFVTRSSSLSCLRALCCRFFFVCCLHHKIITTSWDKYDAMMDMMSLVSPHMCMNRMNG